MGHANKALTGRANVIAAHTPSDRAIRSVSLSGWLLLLTAAFIVYGSLYPFSFVDPPIFSWAHLFAGYWWTGSRGDILANISLFIPYGFFGALYLRDRDTAWPSLLLLLAGILIAVALQVAQVFLPDRTPAAGDAIWNTVGMAAAYLVGHFSAAVFGGRSSPGIRRWSLSDCVIVLGMIAFEWLPFIPTLDFQPFKDNIKTLFDPSVISVPEMVLHAGVLFIGGLTLRNLFDPGIRGMLLALLTLSGLVAGRVFLVAAGWDCNVFLGAMVGLLLTVLVWRGRGDTRAWSLATVVLAALLVGGLWPFQLKTYPTPFGWIPFEGLLSGDLVVTARGLLGQALMYFSLFVLVGRMRGALVATTIVLGLIVLAIELAQCYLLGRAGEITPVLVVVVAAVLARMFHRTGEMPAAIALRSQARMSRALPVP
jgi:VanZ family protein